MDVLHTRTLSMHGYIVACVDCEFRLYSLFSQVHITYQRSRFCEWLAIAGGQVCEPEKCKNVVFLELYRCLCVCVCVCLCVCVCVCGLYCIHV